MKPPVTATLLLLALILFASCGPRKPEAPNSIPQYSIGQFYKNARIFAGAFSPDETRLLVTSDQSGIFNLREIAIFRTP